MAESCVWTRPYAGSTWSTAWGALWEGVRSRRGVVKDANGTAGPRLTRAEASGLIREVKSTASMVGVSWPGWYQLARFAYGQPGFTTSHPNRPYPAQWTPLLWQWVQQLAHDLDDADTSEGARRIWPDCERYDEFAVEARRAADEDGGKKCRVPVPGVPEDKWPPCPSPPNIPTPPELIPTIGSLLRPLLVVGAIYLGVKLLDGDQSRRRRVRR